MSISSAPQDQIPSRAQGKAPERIDFQERLDFRERLDFMEIDAETIATLRAMRPVVEAGLGPLLAHFYEKVASIPQMRQFFHDKRHMDHARQKQMEHWRLLFEANFTADYEQAVLTVGRTHARLGLEPRWYLGAYALIGAGLAESLLAPYWPKLLPGSQKQMKSAASSLGTLWKALLLDMELSVSAYLEATEAERRKAEAKRRALEEQQHHAIKLLGAALARLAQGDLVSRLDDNIGADFHALRQDFNDTVGKVHQILTAMGQATDSIRGGTDEMARSADELARRTEQQAANLQETAATLDKITRGTAEAATRAHEASAIAASTRDEAVQSGRIVAEATNAMSAIETSSQQISHIIGVIDEIALQTNLLALNAGVEAARAGETGKGFAVIASEVRALAQRSADAAKEIKALIRTSEAEVTVGVERVGNAGQALERIIARAEEIDGFVAEIAESTRQQASGLAEINSAITQLDQITQQNAAMVEQSTAMTHLLADETSDLARLMEMFQLERAASEPYVRKRVAEEQPEITPLAAVA
ncbi:globin-coupled sensor protein [Beijerinckia mobilis]|uniref:globin-coupled sensor protein n=1 Tax=Beijerinckia mobilis TaxID=231434 RepID=UPI000A051452|nr:globin-coupled sensor protein [Beijerinckia mobilis]